MPNMAGLWLCHLNEMKCHRPAIFRKPTTMIREISQPMVHMDDFLDSFGDKPAIFGNGLVDAL